MAINYQEISQATAGELRRVAYWTWRAGLRNILRTLLAGAIKKQEEAKSGYLRTSPRASHLGEDSSHNSHKLKYALHVSSCMK
jgi:hypothetical protein